MPRGASKFASKTVKSLGRTFSKSKKMKGAAKATTAIAKKKKGNTSERVAQIGGALTVAGIAGDSMTIKNAKKNKRSRDIEYRARDEEHSKYLQREEKRRAKEGIKSTIKRESVDEGKGALIRKAIVGVKRIAKGKSKVLNARTVGGAATVSSIGAGVVTAKADTERENDLKKREQRVKDREGDSNRHEKYLDKKPKPTT